MERSHCAIVQITFTIEQSLYSMRNLIKALHHQTSSNQTVTSLHLLTSFESNVQIIYVFHFHVFVYMLWW